MHGVKAYLDALFVGDVELDDDDPPLVGLDKLVEVRRRRGVANRGDDPVKRGESEKLTSKLAAQTSRSSGDEVGCAGRHEGGRRGQVALERQSGDGEDGEDDKGEKASKSSFRNAGTNLGVGGSSAWPLL
jgi:hypothetical protein